MTVMAYEKQSVSFNHKEEVFPISARVSTNSIDDSQLEEGRLSDQVESALDDDDNKRESMTIIEEVSERQEETQADALQLHDDDAFLSLDLDLMHNQFRGNRPALLLATNKSASKSRSKVREPVSRSKPKHLPVPISHNSKNIQKGKSSHSSKSRHSTVIGFLSPEERKALDDYKTTIFADLAEFEGTLLKALNSINDVYSFKNKQGEKYLILNCKICKHVKVKFEKLIDGGIKYYKTSTFKHTLADHNKEGVLPGGI